MDQRDDNTLMFEIRAGALDEFGELYARHRARVYAICVQMTARADDAADLTQETFLRVLRYRKSFRGDARFTTWLYRIARNVCLDRIERDRRRDQVHSEWQRESPATSFDSSEAKTAEIDLRRLETALERLPADRREVIVLTRYHGLGSQELAEVLGCTPGAARVRIHRALQELRGIYSQLESDDEM